MYDFECLLFPLLTRVKYKWLYNTVTSSMLQIKTEERDI